MQINWEKAREEWINYALDNNNHDLLKELSKPTWESYLKLRYRKAFSMVYDIPEPKEGIQPGDKAKVVRNSALHGFDLGDIITFVEKDDEDVFIFKKQINSYYWLKQRLYEYDFKLLKNGEGKLK